MDAPINSDAIATMNAAVVQAQAMIEAGRMQAEASRFSGFAAIAAGVFAFIGGYVASGPQRRELGARVSGVRYTILVVLDRYANEVFNHQFGAFYMEEGDQLDAVCPELPGELGLSSKAEHALLGTAFVSAMVRLHREYHEHSKWCAHQVVIGTMTSQVVPDYRGSIIDLDGPIARVAASKAYEGRLRDLGVCIGQARRAALPWPQRVTARTKRWVRNRFGKTRGMYSE